MKSIAVIVSEAAPTEVDEYGIGTNPQEEQRITGLIRKLKILGIEDITVVVEYKNEVLRRKLQKMGIRLVKTAQNHEDIYECFRIGIEIIQEEYDVILGFSGNKIDISQKELAELCVSDETKNDVAAWSKDIAFKSKKSALFETTIR